MEKYRVDINKKGGGRDDDLKMILRKKNYVESINLNFSI